MSWDGRICLILLDKAAFFACEEPHIFEAHGPPQRMGAVFGDPYHSLCALHNRVRELAGQCSVSPMFNEVRAL